jgi:Fur family ferric uptake transcriptional regulator
MGSGGFQAGRHGSSGALALYIQDRRLNVTAQREAIVEQFLRIREHVSIDELLLKVRKRQPKVGYATVYRTLKLLVDSGLAVERQFGDGRRATVVGNHPIPDLHERGLISSSGTTRSSACRPDLKRLGGFTVLRRPQLYGLAQASVKPATAPGSGGADRIIVTLRECPAFA